MKFLKSVFLLGLLGSSLASCSSNKYVCLGETVKSGKLSQTIMRLDYMPATYGVGENEQRIELEYSLRSDYDSIVALSGSGYSAIFDENINNGGIFSKKVPTSISPDKSERITLTLSCFKDWKTVTVSYKDNNNNSYSFSLRSADYPDKANNCYPTLKQGESFFTNDGKASVTFNSLQTTLIGSAYADATEDNLEFNLTINSLSSETISLPVITSYYSLKCDSGFSSSMFNGATPNLPSSLPAFGTVRLNFIIILSKQWKKMVFGCDQGLYFRLTLLHSDIVY